MDNINRIGNLLRENSYINSPHQAAQDLSILAGEYSFIMGQLELILQKKPAIWSKMRPNHKSDTACEREWEATSDGMLEETYRLRAKSVEKMMSALKSLLRVAEGEARNTF